MSGPSAKYVVAVAVLAVAAGARFAGLGAWSFGSDEVATVSEAEYFLDGGPVTADPLTRLPRIAPVGYVVHGLSYRTLGRTEFAGRAPAAVAGALLCGLAVVGLWSALGGWAAAATGLLLALNPECVFFSQYDRYYALGALAAAGCVLAALEGVRRGSVVWMAAAAGVAAFAVFMHLLLAGLIVGLIAVALLAPGLPARQRLRLAAPAVASGVVIAAVYALYLAPLASGWNAGAEWGYSIPRALAGGVNQLGLPTALLAGLGVVMLFATQNPLRGFWLVWAGGWAASLVVLPRLVAFHPGYSFLYVFGAVVPAGYAVGVIAERLTGPRLVPFAWLLTAVLLNAPSLASHYADGTRHDFRSAARFADEHRRPGEAVAAVSPGNFAFYAPSLTDADRLNPDRLLDGLKRIGESNRATWVLLTGGRSPRDAAAQRWLDDHCRLKAAYRKPRFDYYDFRTEVYYFEPK